jgi:hypothetical protein
LVGKGLQYGASLLNGAVDSTVTPILYPEAAAASSLASRTTNMAPEAASAAEAAAQRLGTFLTPGESTGSIPVLANEARLATNPEQQSVIEKALLQRSSVLHGAVNDMVNSLVPEGVDAAEAAKQALYEKVAPMPISDAAQQKLASNPIIANNVSKMLKDPNWNTEGLDPNSVGFWDKVKQYMDHNINYDKVSAGGADMKSAVGTLRDTIDGEVPEYGQARSTAQRLILQRNLQNQINDIKLNPADDTPALNQVYDKLFSTQAQRNEILKTIQTANPDPAASQQAQDLMNTLGAVRTSKLPMSLSKAVSGDTQGVASSKGLLSDVWNRAKEFTMEKERSAMIGNTLNPNWQQTIANTKPGIGVTAPKAVIGGIGNAAGYLGGKAAPYVGQAVNQGMQGFLSR